MTPDSNRTPLPNPQPADAVARPGPADRRPPGRQSAREEGRAVMTMSTSSITVTTANGGAATGAASGSVTVS